MIELLTIINQMRKFYDECLADVRQQYELSRFEVDVIGFLYNNPDKDIANDIVEYRMISKANVSKAVDALINRGLLSSVRDNCDRRKIHLKLTDKAMPVAKDILSAQDGYRNELFSGFSETEKESYIRFFRRIGENARRYMEGK